VPGPGVPGPGADRAAGPDAGEPPRRPRSVYAVGGEPDARFSMANERTALAWVRTALAVVAAGIGLTTVARLAALPGAVDALAAVLCVVGAALAGVAVRGWQRRERAMRLGRPLPAPAALPWLAGVLAATGLLLALIVGYGLR
jgi:putative membrane protein